MIKKLKGKLKRVLKHIKIKIIINKRIILCSNIESEEYLRCLNCKRLQRCYKKYIKRFKWII